MIITRSFEFLELLINVYSICMIIIICNNHNYYIIWLLPYVVIILICMTITWSFEFFEGTVDERKVKYDGTHFIVFVLEYVHLSCLFVLKYFHLRGDVCSLFIFMTRFLKFDWTNWTAYNKRKWNIFFHVKYRRC